MGHVLLLVILLVVATLLVDVVVVSTFVASHPIVPALWPHPGVVALFALSMAQAGLIALWTGFAGRSLPWRLLGLVLTIGIWSQVIAWTLERRDYGSAPTDWTCLLLAQSLVILLPLRAARLWGVRLVRACPGEPSQAAAPDVRRVQFSLGYLLSWITVLAVILGLAQYALSFQRVLSLLSEFWRVLPVLAVSHAGLVLAGLWAVLSSAPLRARCLVVVLTVAATLGASHLLTEFPPELWAYAAWCILQLLCVVASLWVFRVAGYRMTRLRRGRQVEAEEAPASPDAG